MWWRLRRFLFWTHLAAGVAAALPLIVMCSTGTLLMYERQTQAWMDRWGVKSHPPAPGAQALDIESLIRKTHLARGVEPESITVFAGANQPVQVNLNRTLGFFYADAYSGSAIGEPSAKTLQFFRRVTALHTSLGVTGGHRTRFKTLVGAVNVVVLFLTVFGIYLWIPRRWTWKHLRSITLLRPRLAGHARDFNWHNSIGIWIVIPMLVIVWTGMAMSYRLANQLTYLVAGTPNTQWRGGNAAAATEPAVPASSLDALLARAKRQSAQWRAITMVLPHHHQDPVDFAIDMSGYSAIGQSAALELDRSGRVVVFTPAGSGGMPAQTFIRYGHTGEAWGVAGQTIAGAASLGGAVLVWTGVAMSLRRFKRWLKGRTRAA